MTELAIAAIVIGLIVVTILFVNQTTRQWLSNNKDAIQTVASLIGVFSVAVAVLSAAATYEFTAEQQRKAAQVQARAAATSAMQTHLQLAVEHPELATNQWPERLQERYKSENVERVKAHPRTARLQFDYAWFAFNAMFTADQIYTQMQQEEWASLNWIETVKALVRRHNTFVCHDAFNIQEYNALFTDLIVDMVNQEDLCATSNLIRTTSATGATEPKDKVVPEKNKTDR